MGEGRVENGNIVEGVNLFKVYSMVWHQRLTPVILATLEAEIRRIRDLEASPSK
jgi:hypothetical protein